MAILALSNTFGRFSQISTPSDEERENIRKLDHLTHSQSSRAHKGQAYEGAQPAALYLSVRSQDGKKTLAFSADLDPARFDEKTDHESVVRLALEYLEANDGKLRNLFVAAGYDQSYMNVIYNPPIDDQGQDLSGQGWCSAPYTFKSDLLP